jgi:aminomethyltransferase|tara:strand:+ start:1905 stop:2939 length:1035 start_codon:yes stop_codon:yes gene_type:complete
MSLRRTPLSNHHRKLGAKMVDFAGWEMPIQYSSIISEHKSVREAAGIFDVSHMGQIFVKGSDAVKFLSYVTTWNMERQKNGDCRYCHILNENGHIIDDTIVYTISNSEYLLVPNASKISEIMDWLLSNSKDFNVIIEDLSDSYFCLALQGPEAPRLLGQHLNTSVNSFQLEKLNEVIVSGTGYTGEKGCELIGPLDQIELHWEALVDMGAIPIGLGARDTLRLEKGYLLSGQDFKGSETTLETNYAWVIDWDHEFIGREALVSQKQEEYPKLSGILLEDRGVLRPGCSIYYNNNKISELTSGSLSPTLRKGIGLSYVDLDVGSEITIEVRGKHLNGRVVRTPFL